MTTAVTEPINTEEADQTSPHSSGKTTPPIPARKRRLGLFAVLRSVLFWSHLVMGTIGGIIILIMSLTGALLGFERQVIARIDGAARVVPPAVNAPRLPLDSLLGRAGIDGAQVAAIGMKAAPTEPVTLRFRERDRAPLLLDPYTGEIVTAPPRGKAAAFMSWLRGWHRWLGATNENRPLFRKFTGVANLAFLFLVLSGLYLWWPKRLSKAAFKTAAVFNPRLSGKARDFNWHNSLGFWSAIPLAIVVATGAFISYQWPGQWMDRLLGNESERAAAIRAMNPPAQSAAPREAASRESAPREAASRESAPRETAQTAARTESPRAVASLALMMAAVESTNPEWQALAITNAAPRDSVVQFAVSEGNTYRPDLKSQYYFNAITGARTRVTSFDSLSPSRKIRGWTRFSHTGEVFGIAGQSVATLVSFVGVILVWTGLALAFRRLVAYLRRMRRAQAA